jgi:hypothetical protein
MRARAICKTALTKKVDEAVSKRLEEVNLRQPLHITSKPYEVTKKGNERDKHKQTGD